MSRGRPTYVAGALVPTAAIALAVLVPGSTADPPGTPHCSPGWHFFNIKKERTKQRVVERQRVENRTRRRSEATFTSTRSKTIGWSSKWNIGGGIEAVVFSVKAEGEQSVSKSVTAQTGVSTTVSIPRKSAVVGTYGVFRRPFTGRLQKGNRYSRCKFNERVTVKLPVGSGWRTKDRRL